MKERKKERKKEGEEKTWPFKYVYFKANNNKRRKKKQ